MDFKSFVITCEVLRVENEGKVSDGIQEIPCRSGIKTLDLVDFDVLPSIYKYNIFPNRNVFDIHERLLI